MKSNDSQKDQCNQALARIIAKQVSTMLSILQLGYYNLVPIVVCFLCQRIYRHL